MSVIKSLTKQTVVAKSDTWKGGVPFQEISGVYKSGSSLETSLEGWMRLSGKEIVNISISALS